MTDDCDMVADWLQTTVGHCKLAVTRTKDFSIFKFVSVVHCVQASASTFND